MKIWSIFFSYFIKTKIFHSTKVRLFLLFEWRFFYFQDINWFSTQNRKKKLYIFYRIHPRYAPFLQTIPIPLISHLLTVETHFQKLKIKIMQIQTENTLVQECETNVQFLSYNAIIYLEAYKTWSRKETGLCI